jgi:hypothetical protein
MKQVLFLLALFIIDPNQPPSGQQGNAYRPTGPVNREMADHSPVAVEIIEQIDPRPGVGYKVAVRATVKNTTNHELQYINPEQFYDVRYSGTGKRVPDTDAGCYYDFLSDCYTRSLPPGIAGPGLPKDVIPMHGSIEILPAQYLDMFYQLTPGEYSVVGYFCASQREGPECFKSNTIRIKIPGIGG